MILTQQQENAMKGRFFVIDGTDGSGKATQTKLLISRMLRENLPVQTIAFPQYGLKSAGPVEDYLAGKFGKPEEVGSRRASVFYAVDRYAASMKISNWLSGGEHVVADRYVASNMGHQGSKERRAEERMAFFKWNDDLEYGMFKIPRPDINIILHVPAAVSMQLIAKRGNVQDAHENLAHLTAAETTYLEIARTFPGFALIECVEEGTLLSPEKIHEKVWTVVQSALSPQQ
jgi:dTMP kinase